MMQFPTFMTAVLACASMTLTACPPTDDTGETGDLPDPEILDPEPADAPSDEPEGRLTCVRNNKPADPTSTQLEVTGYVRTLADPDAEEEVPAAGVELFNSTGTSLGVAFADASKDGRVAVSIGIGDEGYTGYAMVTHEDYMDWRFQSSLPITDTSFNGWTWLVTEEDRDAVITDLGLTVTAGDGYLVGVVHDCDAFGVSNAVVTVDGSTDGVIYLNTFQPDPTRTYTGASGRFIVPEPALGTAEIKAYGRLEAGGPLVILSSVTTTVEGDEISAVGLEPRISYY